MSQATITIGRNIGNVPMHDYVWENFQAEISDLFSELYVSSPFQGQWENVIEESYLFIGEIRPEMLDKLEVKLSHVAKVYNQDAIGLILNSRKESLVYKAA